MAKKKAAAKTTAKPVKKASTNAPKKTATKTAATKKAAPKKSARKGATAGQGKRKKAAKRELIDTGTDKRYVRRNDQGQFDEVDDVGRSLSQDRRRHAKTASKPGQGDRGDRPAKKS